MYVRLLLLFVINSTPFFLDNFQLNSASVLPYYCLRARACMWAIFQCQNILIILRGVELGLHKNPLNEKKKKWKKPKRCWENQILNEHECHFSSILYSIRTGCDCSRRIYSWWKWKKEQKNSWTVTSYL